MENWLRQTFQDAPTDGPATKMIKFSDIHQGLSQQFPSDNISAQCCSKIVDNIFPESKRVRVGKQRVCYVVGLQSFVSPEHVQAENIQLKATVQQLQERIRELEGGTSPSMLPKCDCTPLLLRQMDSLLQHGDHIIHGPSTPARFSDFSVQALTDEICSAAPDVHRLFLSLGDTERNQVDEGTPVEERKAIMSLCMVLNARQRQANGLQLLISFMLIARATSKQVKQPLHIKLYSNILLFAGNYCPQQCRDMCIIPKNMGLLETTN